MGFSKIWDPDKVVLIYDHLVPTSAVEDVRHFKIGDQFVKEYGLTHVHRSDGICHQLMPEKGYAKPGNIVFGTDSIRRHMEVSDVSHQGSDIQKWPPF